ncbi:hypothetical protein QR680_006159 [Steinernema hermaphroditum]|uniref:PDZ domain-containing protein n=1 Tax=Steinernema hermaphroditum TaxID=289476 RepID=A0AA39HUI0_9BILA|nr:hypothetical protein QR680_006159 [Steinernema hermaphroditum]
MSTMSAVQPLQPLYDVANERRNVVVELAPLPNGLDIKLCDNLTVRSISHKSKAIFAFIVGDKILDINGTAPINAQDALQLIRNAGGGKIRFTVSRVANRSPVSIDRVKQIHLKRLDGYCYFVVTLKKTPGAHLKLGLKTFRGKCYVQRIDKNSIAANSYLTGDNILDINGERINDTETFKKRLVECLSVRGVFSTVIERPESLTALRTVHATMTLFSSDVFPADANAIALREVERFKESIANPGKKPKPILKGRFPSAERTVAGDDGGISVEAMIADDAPKSVFIGDEFDTKRKKKRRVTINKNAQEAAIESDVQNPNMLQKAKGVLQQSRIAVSYPGKRTGNSSKSGYEFLM